MICYNNTNNTITIHTKNSTYQMKIDSKGVLLHTYYGPRVRSGDFSNWILQEDRGFSPQPSEAGLDRTYSLDTQPQEYSSSGVGDFRIPSIEATSLDGSYTVDLRYVSYSIEDGKYTLDGLPSFYDNGGEWETLRVLLKDTCTNLTVELLYGVFAECDLITRAVKVSNSGTNPVSLERVMSTCVDFPSGTFHTITLGGAYGREREPVRMPLTQGIHTAQSIRGSSSHQQNPFTILCSPDTTEDSGDCWGFALVYSGNFLAQTEYTQFHETRFVMGIHPFHFSWKLKAGETFCAPEAAMVFSNSGLSTLSQRFHKAIRLNLCRGQWKDARRPILINNWEATYFAFDADKIVSIAEKASKVGVEMMVMDDGWFGERNDDFRGLGDWDVNEKKLPGGLSALAERIEALGMKFGLWVEPEMVNEDSKLYRLHPDWAFKIPGREGTRSRHQLVLDLSRKEVRDYILTNLRNTLSSAHISYVKWDMNRSLTDVFSLSLPSDQQGEVYHRYVLGVYEILEALHQEFPHILIEGCSGGGGRFDCGMLHYTPQIWCSDNTDAIERLRIQYGTSFCYPCSTMGAHVSAVPNGMTRRCVPLHTRGVVAEAGTFGYELDLNELSEEELAEVPQQIAHFKKNWKLVTKGTYYRLGNPFEEAPFYGWMHVSEDQTRALASVVTGVGHANPIRGILRMKGLDPNRDYKVNGTVYGGDVLLHVGISLPILDEYRAVQFEIEAV